MANALYLLYLKEQNLEAARTLYRKSRACYALLRQKVVSENRLNAIEAHYDTQTHFLVHHYR